MSSYKEAWNINWGIRKEYLAQLSHSLGGLGVSINNANLYKAINSVPFYTWTRLIFFEKYLWRSAFHRFQMLKFSGGTCPQTHPQLHPPVLYSSLVRDLFKTRNTCLVFPESLATALNLPVQLLDCTGYINFNLYWRFIHLTCIQLFPPSIHGQNLPSLQP